ncbi:MAG: hypothetical protein LBO09_01470 [Candidatus Peribacteria bacterium]|jgi:hypothetical protein|nr:hypothetical protein [Candidatus Peribacteria bacterium]
MTKPQITFSTTDNVEVEYCTLSYFPDNGIEGTVSSSPITISPATSPLVLGQNGLTALDADESFHIITITCFDTAGNSATNTISFPPVVIFTTPTTISNTSIEDATVKIISERDYPIENILLTGTIPNATLRACVGAGGDTTSPYDSPVVCEIHTIDQSGQLIVQARDAITH